MDETEQVQAEETAAENEESVAENVGDGTTHEGETKKKKKKTGYPFWKRLLIFLLGTTIGFVSCLGAIVGAGFWIYRNVSLQKLEEMGIAIPLPEALQGKGEVDITEYTIAALIGDIMYFTDESNDVALSIHTLRERYGLNVLAEVEAFLPEKLTMLPFSALAEEGALNTILSTLDLATILNLLPEGTLSEPLIDALRGKELSGLGEGGIGALLSDVKLGYLLGANYVKQDGEWILVPADPNQKTLLDHFSDLGIGDLISTDGSTDLLGTLKEKMSDVALTDLFGIPAESASMLAGVRFGDIIVRDPATGTHYMDFATAFDDLRFGNLAGYELRGGKWYDPNGVEAGSLMASIFDYTLGDFTSGEFSINEILGDATFGSLAGCELRGGKWYDPNGVEATVLMARIYSRSLADFTSGGFSLEDVLDGLTVGELMGYTKQKDGSFVDADGKPVTGLNDILASASLNDMLSGDLAFDTLFSGEKVGALLNYTQDARGRWHDANGNLVEGLNASIADITMDQFFGTESLDAAEVFAGVYLGEVMGFTVASYKTDGVTPDQWRDAHGNLVEGFDAEIASVKVGSLSDGDGVDFKEVFGEELVGDMQGHVYNSEENQWYTENGEALGALDNVIANMTVGEIIDGEINFVEAFGEEKVGDLQGYTYYGDQWYVDEFRTTPLNTLDNAIASWTLKEVMDGNIDYKASLSDAYLGEFLGYTGYEGNWRDANGVKVEGLSAVVANLRFGDLEDNNAMIDCISEATVGDLLGFRKEGGVWLDKDGNRVTRVLELLATTKLEDMNDEIDSWYLGDLMGFEKRGNTWRDPDGNSDGVVLRFADLKVSDLSDSQVVHETIDGLKMYEILGYTQKPDGNWYHGDDRVTGVMAYLATHTVAGLGSEVENMTLADALGYQKVGGVWKDENGNAVSALLSALADTKINEIGVRADALTLAEALGYTKTPDGKWKDEKGQPASSFMAALADAKISEIGSRMDTLKLSDVFENTNSGFFKIIGGDTKLLDLDARIDKVFGSGEGAATIGDFMDAGIVSNIQGEAATKLANRIGPNWRAMPVASFIDAIINFVVSVPGL